MTALEPRADAGQLRPSGFRANDAGIAAAQAAFAAHHFVRLERFVAPPLLARWLERLDASPFVRRVYDDWTGPPPIDLFLDADDVDCAIAFAMNDAPLFRAVERIARCGRIGSFLTNIHRMVAGADHRDRWHNDVDGERAVGISINVSSMAYSGGALQLADAATRDLLATIENPVAGDAVLFEISDALVHCVSPLESGSRTVLAGWFMLTPDERAWREALRKRLA